MRTDQKGCIDPVADCAGPQYVTIGTGDKPICLNCTQFHAWNYNLAKCDACGTV